MRIATALRAFPTACFPRRRLTDRCRPRPSFLGAHLNGRPRFHVMAEASRTRVDAVLLGAGALVAYLGGWFMLLLYVGESVCDGPDSCGTLATRWDLLALAVGLWGCATWANYARNPRWRSVTNVWLIQAVIVGGLLLLGITSRLT